MLLFGPAAAAIGADRVMVRVPEGATCGEILASLGESEPRLRGLAAGARLAVNHEFAGADRVVRGGEEIALIAMVSGG